jgi:AcrR family transcriptional regulator
VTKRRIETRQRLLVAARHVFSEEGFGRSTVEQVCERAGYTRGAFYSNFSSLEELFLEMWSQQSAQLLLDLQVAVDRPATREAIASGDPAAVVAHVLEAVPVDDRWYRITADFTAHALRNPDLRGVMAAREQAIIDTLMPIVSSALAAAGRSVTDPAALGAALVAVHDGTTVQCLMSPDDPVVFRRRTELFVRVIDSFLVPLDGEGSP